MRDGINLRGREEGERADLRGFRLSVKLGEFVGDVRGVFGGSFLIGDTVLLQGVGKRLNDELGALAAEACAGQVVLREFADGAFERLTGETGAVDAAEDSGLGRADIVAVETGDGEGLQNVEFDQFHVFAGSVEVWKLRLRVVRKHASFHP